MSEFFHRVILHAKSLTSKPITFFWICGMIGNVLNWVFNWYMLQILNLEEYAFLTLLFTFQYWASIPAVALQTTINKFAADALHQQQPLSHLTSTWRLSWIIGLVCFISIALGQPWLGSFFQIIHYQSLLIFAGAMICIFFPFAWLRGMLNAHQRYHLAGGIVIVEGLTKLSIGYLSQFNIHRISIAASSLPLSIILPLSILIVTLAISSIKLPLIGTLKAPTKFFSFLASSTFLNVGVILPFTLDIALVKHFFPPEQAGMYAALTLIGKTIFFLNYSVIGLLVPVMAIRTAKQRSSFGPLAIVICLVLLINIFTLMVSSVFPQYTIRFLLKDAYTLVLPYVTPYLIAVACVSLTAIFTTYNLIHNRFIFPIYSLMAVVVEVVGISLFHDSLTQVVQVLMITFICLLTVTSFTQYLMYRSRRRALATYSS